MIIEVPIEDIINPHVDEPETIIDEFDADDQLIKNVDFTNCQQCNGFKEGLQIAIADKNINISKRPGFLTIDLDRREEPNTAHEAYLEEKDDFDLEFDQFG